MTERKYTDEEVIKALECCAKNSTYDECCECLYVECSTQKGCVGELMEDAINLINRQKAEIENLQNVIIRSSKETMSYVAWVIEEERESIKLKHIRKLEAEIDILVRKHGTLLDELSEKNSEIENLQKNNAKLLRDLQCAEEFISDTHDKMLHLVPRLKFIKKYIHKGEKTK